MSFIRREIKKNVEKIRIAGRRLFEVWIHEEESHLPGDQNCWDECMATSRRADVFIVLYNGRAGWAGTSERIGDHVGICHAEFHEAFYHCPSKIRTIQFPEVDAEDETPDHRFQKYFNNQGIFGTQVETGEQAIAAAVEATTAALLDLARAGVGLNAKGNYYAGEALTWSRMDFQKRREVTTGVVSEYLSQQIDSQLVRDNIVSCRLARKSIAFVCDCIPAGLSTPAARELVGQPFLRDHQFFQHLPKNTYGPVHVIACQKAVTESQAIKQLGFPDAIVVSAPFGIYIADEIQKIQMVFIANCRDETSTRHHVQRFLRWLIEQGEAKLMAERAVSRRKIVKCIASEL